MQRWPAYLAAVPASLLRLIAAANRVSLPRRSDPEERLARVRRALCRPAAVRAAYFALAPEHQAAAQALRAAPRCLSPAAVEARLGPIRPLAQLRHDRAPRSPAERLLLLGWLLPRPAGRNHPACYVVPPELRAWLPRPLPVATTLPAPAPAEPPPATLPLALRAATALLVAAAQSPLPLRRDGILSAEGRRRLRPLLADLDPALSDALVAWTTPLLRALDLLAPHGAAAMPSPAASRFLAAPAARRLQLLRDAWSGSPEPEPALLPPRASRRGLFWPALRRRLIIWAEAAPAAANADPTATFEALTAAFGPLADGFTHGYGRHARTPWNRRTAVAVWAEALRGPLTWLGFTGGPYADGRLNPATLAGGAAAGWSYHGPEALQVAHDEPGAELLTVALFADALAGDEAGLTLRLTRHSVVRAAGHGDDPARLRAALIQRAGPLPEPWAATLAPAGEVRIARRDVVLAEQPDALRGALRRRSVRRLVEDVLAPGIALARPGQAEALAEKLARHGHIVRVDTPPKETAAPPAELTRAEVAALLVAGAHYRAAAPPGAPPAPSEALTERLRAGLPPALAAATDEAIRALLARPAPAGAASTPPVTGPRPSTVELLWRLRDAIRRREPLTIAYQGAGDPEPLARTIRPLALERHGDVWYLSAYCLLARGDRCFRLDRVLALEAAAVDEPRPRAPLPAPKRRGRVARGRAAPRVGFFAGPPAPPPGSPLVGVWLEDDHWPGAPPRPEDEAGTQPPGPSDEIVERRGGQLADAEDDDPRGSLGIEWVAAHTVAARLDQREQLTYEDVELRPVQDALEHAALHARPVPLEQFQHPGTPPTVGDIVADQREHSLCPLPVG